MSLSLDDLAQRVAAGERPALARALSLAERDEESGDALVARLARQLGRAHVVGITGPPGAGKSTLVGVLVRQFLQRGNASRCWRWIPPVRSPAAPCWATVFASASAPTTAALSSAPRLRAAVSAV